MQSASSRIWTRVTVSNSYGDNHYTTGISTYSFKYCYLTWIVSFVFKHHYVTLTTQFWYEVKEFQVLLINTNNSIQHYLCIHLHHHHVVLLARISLTLSCHFSLSFIASGRSSGLHHVSSHSCCRYVQAGRPAFARPYVGVHRSISLMSSFLLLQQCSACLVHLTWIVFMMEGRWPYSWCFVGCCRQDLFNIAHDILV